MSSDSGSTPLGESDAGPLLQGGSILTVCGTPEIRDVVVLPTQW